MMRAICKIVFISLCLPWQTPAAGQNEARLCLEAALQGVNKEGKACADYAMIEHSLDKLASVPANSPINIPQATLKQLEKSLDLLEASLQPLDQNQRSFRLNDALNQELNAAQKSLVASLLHGLNKALCQGSIESIHVGHDGGLVIGDGTVQSLQLNTLVRLPVSMAERPLSSSEQGGEAQVEWKWRWWGIRIYFSPQAASYLCRQPEDVLNQLPFPPWVEQTLQAVACSLHLLNDGKQGLTTNITWRKQYWLDELDWARLKAL